MNIAFVSGKGGAGKTTVSTVLSEFLARERPVQYVDLDVEEPNGHLFLKPQINQKIPATVPVPQVDLERCNHCGKCSKFCAFGSIASLPATTMVFPGLCHGCGGCSLVCPQGAINQVMRPIGVIEKGMAGKISFLQGCLDVGEAMAPPLIDQVCRHIKPDGPVLLDSPPGANCSTASVLSRCDLVVLVAEPTPFGLNDMIIAVEMIRLIGRPFGVVVNRHGMGDDRVERWCRDEDVPLWGQIPYRDEVARLIASGSHARKILEAMGKPVEEAAGKIMEVAGI